MISNMENYDDCGYLEIIKGPMFSGKTTRLLDRYKKFSYCGIPMLVINYANDTRYSETELSTHDKQMIPCTRVYLLSDIIDLSNFDNKKINTVEQQFIDSKVILINEGQFFTDIVKWVTIAVEKHHKQIYICGLNTDFKRNTFGDWLNLERLSDNVVQLQAFCSNCKKRPALFSHRLTNESTIEVIGSESYIPVCRKCYNDINKIKNN